MKGLVKALVKGLMQNKNRIGLTAIVALALTSFVAQSSPKIELKGQFTQGAMIIGKAQPGAKIKLDDKTLLVSDQGDFVFGFGRDDKLSHELTIKNLDGQLYKQTLNLTEREYKVERIQGVESKYVSPPKTVLSRIREDNQKVSAARAIVTDRLDFLAKIIMPVEGRFSGFYGSQRIFNGVPKRPHFGLDIAATVGTKVKAPLSGKVVLAENDMYYTGGTLILEHGHGINSTFLHLSKLLVKKGDWVKQGDIIAEVGATGRVTGPHLDWRMNWNNVRLDPQLLIAP